MRQKLKIQGGSAVNRVIEKIREAGGFVVNPGKVEQISLSEFAVEIDWQAYYDEPMKEALKQLKKDGDIIN